MQKLVRFMISFSLLCCVFTVFADDASNLASITVPIADQTQATLFKMAPDAMTQVLVKMSGNPNVATIPAVRAALAQASQWIQSFSYTTVPGANNTSTLSVTIQFEPQALNNLLHQTKQPVLAVTSRPMTLAWINVDQGTTSSLAPLASGDQSNVGKALMVVSKQIGLPVILPAMDLEDQGFVNNDSTLPFDLQKLASAGDRYHIKSILAGNLSMAVDGSWQAQWMYLLNSESHQWQDNAATPDALFQKALVHVGEMLAATSTNNTSAAGPQSLVNMQVLNVNGLSDYALVMNDLKQLTLIRQVIISDLNGTTISFQLMVQGGRTALENALQHNSDLAEIPPGSLTPDQAQTQALYYQFNSTNNAAPAATTNTTAGNE